jgi:hypothetical protein
MSNWQRDAKHFCLSLRAQRGNLVFREINELRDCFVACGSFP